MELLGSDPTSRLGAQTKCAVAILIFLSQQHSWCILGDSVNTTVGGLYLINEYIREGYILILQVIHSDPFTALGDHVILTAEYFYVLLISPIVI